MFSLEEIHEYLRSNFPMCDWRITSNKWNEKAVIWRPTNNFEMELKIGRFKETVHDGAEYIGVDWNTKNEGSACPCLNLDEVNRNIQRAIERFFPKLLDDQQLTLF